MLGPWPTSRWSYAVGLRSPVFSFRVFPFRERCALPTPVAHLSC